MENLKNIKKNHIMQVMVKGEFKDINGRNIPYRTIIEMPYCIEEWLISNIKNRYILESIQKGYEYKEDKKERNLIYDGVEKVMTINIESIKDSGKEPTFYNKSIFDFNYSEIQDFSVAFGIHEINKEGTIEELRQQALFGYLKNIKGLTEEKIKQFSFYKYDKKRMRHYIEFDNNDKEIAVIKRYRNADVKEFEEKDIKTMDKRRLSDIMFEEDDIEEKETMEKMENKNNKIKDNKIENVAII